MGLFTRSKSARAHAEIASLRRQALAHHVQATAVMRKGETAIAYDYVGLLHDDYPEPVTGFMYLTSRHVFWAAPFAADPADDVVECRELVGVDFWKMKDDAGFEDNAGLGGYGPCVSLGGQVFWFYRDSALFPALEAAIAIHDDDEDEDE